MADLIDVENVLVSLIAAAVYLNGTGSASIANADIRVFAGWPISANLDADIAAGKINISVYSTLIERNTTRYSKDWQQQSAPVQTLTLTIAGQTVTVGGTVSTPQNVMLMVNRAPYVYAVQAGDTLTSIATALSTLVAGASNVGAVITLPGTANLSAARVGASGTSIREIRRQERVFQIVIWAPSQASRDLVAAAVDVTLAGMEFISLPDQSLGRIIYRGSPMTDGLQKVGIYRRDLNYSVEYATTQTKVDTQITQEQLNVSVQNDGSTQYTTPRITYF